jgi:hypothetical protein
VTATAPPAVTAVLFLRTQPCTCIDEVRGTDGYQVRSEDHKAPPDFAEEQPIKDVFSIVACAPTRARAPPFACVITESNVFVFF